MTRCLILPYHAGAAGAAGAQVRVRPLAGAHELAIDEAIENGASAVELGTQLIARCTAVGDQPMAIDAARGLVLGDREVLLRGIYAETFGSRLEAHSECADGCSEIVEYALDLGDLAAPVPEAGPEHLVRIPGGTARCRVPTAADIEAALASSGAFAVVLAGLCSDQPVPPAVFAAAIARLDPNAECWIALSCPNCGADFAALLDAVELFRRRLAQEGGLLGQVDLLARTYGWSESEIAALPRARRRRYCELAAGGAA